jgi:oligopeptidase A
MTNNPLLIDSALPQFSLIKPEHAAPAMTQLISESKAMIEQLVMEPSFTWANLMEPLERISDRFDKTFSPVSHLNSVTNTSEWRDAYNQCLPLLTEYGTWAGQYKPLYDAIHALSTNTTQLNTVQKKIINDELRDFQLSGIALEGEDKKIYAELSTQLSALTTKFEENILDATDAWQHHILDEAELSGLPEHTIALAKATAEEKKLDGWLLTLDFPSYYAVMKHADNEALRRTFYDAYATRASDQGPGEGKYDNSQVMLDILSVRKQLAVLLGFSHYSARSLATKMAKDEKQVLAFLKDLGERAKPIAEQEIETLKKFAKEYHQKETLHAWDLTYYSEKLLQHDYSISQETLRPYFPEEMVLSGMFKVINKLYGMTVTEISNADTWHDGVKLFEITDETGQTQGQFFTDLYARPHKRGGAWMDDYCGRRKTGTKETQTPVAFLTCNFTPPLAGKPALLTHDEVVTLFHEFGHGLHHMLTQVDYLSASGINNVAWDAVELPSQFMENFCWESSVIPMISRHFETGESLPKTLLDNMLAAKNFHSGMQMCRQIEFSLFDFQLHMTTVDSSAEIQALLNHIRAEIAVITPPDYNRFQHSFSHIFAGGYAAGYYSYKWAEVLSSDAYAMFEENGVLDRKTGEAFLLAILQKGGSEDALDLFVAFRGREPNTDALLKHSGIVE